MNLSIRIDHETASLTARRTALPCRRLDAVAGHLGGNARSRQSARAEATPLLAEGETCHLPVQHRRRLARRYLRPQAEAHRRRRQNDRRGRRPVERETAAAEASVGL